MDAIEALKTRRCVRSFKPDPLQKETLEDIIDCGRLAATARNEQPWEFVVVTDPAMRKQIADATDFGKFIANAPANADKTKLFRNMLIWGLSMSVVGAVVCWLAFTVLGLP